MMRRLILNGSAPQRDSIRLIPPRHGGGDAVDMADSGAIVQALARWMGGEAAAAAHPWVRQALTEASGRGGTWWHTATTDAGPAWLTLTLLSDADQARHALLTLDGARGEKALEARLAAARLDTMIGTAGTLCHTINNALTALLGNAEMLQETEGLRDDAKMSATLIMRAGDRLEKLTSRTLQLARARNPRPGRCDPTTQLTQLCARLRQAGAGLELSLGRGSGPQCLGLLLVEPAAFEEATSHLISNAITASGPDGHVRLCAETEEGPAWPGFAILRLTVEDDGPGLPSSEVPYPGQAFLSVNRQSGQHPIGLASVRAFATALGGAFEAAARPEGGARVTLRLPVLQTGDTAP